MSAAPSVAGSLAGRTAVVTGGGSDIGAALTRALVGAGVAVVCADLDLDAATKTVASVTGRGVPRAVQVDVTDARQVQQAVDDVVAEHGVST